MDYVRFEQYNGFHEHGDSAPANSARVKYICDNKYKHDVGMSL